MTLRYMQWATDILSRGFLSIYVSVLYSTEYSLVANNISAKAGTHVLQKLPAILWADDVAAVNYTLCDICTRTIYGVPGLKSRMAVLGL